METTDLYGSYFGKLLELEGALESFFCTSFSEVDKYLISFSDINLEQKQVPDEVLIVLNFRNYHFKLLKENRVHVNLRNIVLDERNLGLANTK